jgi:membrane-bound ClpP family serine protease
MNTTNKNEGNEDPEIRSPKLIGTIYIILGLVGLAFSVYALITTLGMVPLFGTVTAGVLIGLLSIIIIIYGYRVFRRDY